MEKWFNVGKIVNTHGIRGEVRVISRTDFPTERYRIGNKLYLFMPNAKGPIELTVASHRTHKNFDLLTFEGFGNVNEVEKFRDGILKVPESERGTLEEGEYYLQDIIGCLVSTIEGEEVGKITEILSPGANDVWVVKGKGGKDILIPYIEDVVKKVDLQEKVILIDPMEGLLP
ncbi:ribosome maturation factor RimM [Mesobacillus zeae]|uniref:Ribosome maturation factor RimM n=1 Tax=Mesobacillus zeae TaxID=1917180 RepID=A0A398BKS6_9BACI|nr:ribosome maturation factor RimM [Mesobacillus zeae]RID87973.1 ribosome maturation factor RimM [Mesobacillus zeae]